MARPATNHEAKKAEILAAAIKSFAAYGYESTSNKTIAKEGGFSAGLIYHYFPGGKNELFAACLEQFQPLKTFSQTIHDDTDAPPEVYLRKMARAYLKLTEDETTMRLIRLIFMEIPRQPELAQIMAQRMAPVVVLPMVSYLGKQNTQGNIKPQHPLAMVMQFFGPLFIRALLRPIENNMPLPPPTNDELVEALVETYLHGLWQDTTSENQT